MNQVASKLEFRIAIIIAIWLNYATQYMHFDVMSYLLWL